MSSAPRLDYQEMMAAQAILEHEAWWGSQWRWRSSWRSQGLVHGYGSDCVDNGRRGGTLMRIAALALIVLLISPAIGWTQGRVVSGGSAVVGQWQLWNPVNSGVRFILRDLTCACETSPCPTRVFMTFALGPNWLNQHTWGAGGVQGKTEIQGGNNMISSGAGGGPWISYMMVNWYETSWRPEGSTPGDWNVIEPGSGLVLVPSRSSTMEYMCRVEGLEVPIGP